ncbi:hypothetical protein B5S30_g2623 [[Candida] boidinii]|nr:hypothetical protein B5S30_g2623 [[Candida] boidinii]
MMMLKPKLKTLNFIRKQAFYNFINIRAQTTQANILRESLDVANEIEVSPSISEGKIESVETKYHQFLDVSHSPRYQSIHKNNDILLTTQDWNLELKTLTEKNNWNIPNKYLTDIPFDTFFIEILENKKSDKETPFDEEYTRMVQDNYTKDKELVFKETKMLAYHMINSNDPIKLSEEINPVLESGDISIQNLYISVMSIAMTSFNEAKIIELHQYLYPLLMKYNFDEANINWLSLLNKILFNKNFPQRIDKINLIKRFYNKIDPRKSGFNNEFIKAAINCHLNLKDFNSIFYFFIFNRDLPSSKQFQRYLQYVLNRSAKDKTNPNVFTAFFNNLKLLKKILTPDEFNHSIDHAVFKSIVGMVTHSKQQFSDFKIFLEIFENSDFLNNFSRWILVLKSISLTEGMSNVDGNNMERVPLDFILNILKDYGLDKNPVILSELAYLTSNNDSQFFKLLNMILDNNDSIAKSGYAGLVKVLIRNATSFDSESINLETFKKNDEAFDLGSLSLDKGQWSKLSLILFNQQIIYKKDENRYQTQFKEMHLMVKGILEGLNQNKVLTNKVKSNFLYLFVKLLQDKSELIFMEKDVDIYHSITSEMISSEISSLVSMEFTIIEHAVMFNRRPSAVYWLNNLLDFVEYFSHNSNSREIIKIRKSFTKKMVLSLKNLISNHPLIYLNENLKIKRSGYSRIDETVFKFIKQLLRIFKIQPNSIELKTWRTIFFQIALTRNFNEYIQICNRFIFQLNNMKIFNENEIEKIKNEVFKTKNLMYIILIGFQQPILNPNAFLSRSTTIRYNDFINKRINVLEFEKYKKILMKKNKAFFNLDDELKDKLFELSIEDLTNNMENNESLKEFYEKYFEFEKESIDSELTYHLNKSYNPIYLLELLIEFINSHDIYFDSKLFKDSLKPMINSLYIQDDKNNNQLQRIRKLNKYQTIDEFLNALNALLEDSNLQIIQFAKDEIINL